MDGRYRPFSLRNLACFLDLVFVVALQAEGNAGHQHGIVAGKEAEQRGHGETLGQELPQQREAISDPLTGSLQFDAICRLARHLGAQPAHAFHLVGTRVP